MDIRINAAPKRTDRECRVRERSIVCFVMVLFFLVGIVRVGFIIFVRGSEYRSEAERRQLYDQIIPAVRGTIYDVNMNPLVTSSSAWILTADPSEIYKFFNVLNIKDENGNVETYRADEAREKYYVYLSKKLARILGAKKDDIKELIMQKDKSYVRIKTEVDASTRLELDDFFSTEYVYKQGETKDKDSKVKAGGFFNYENDSVRIYPDNNFASTVIGVTNNDGDGVSGVERTYNTYLKGEDGRRLTAKDASNNAIDSSYETVYDAVAGDGVVLTIDSNIQMYLENALSQALENTGAKGVYGIAMDVDTGAVLAISDKPDFDANDPYKILDKDVLKELEKHKGKSDYSQLQTNALYNQWNSFCVTSTYEPGSTFKIFTAAAALEEGVADLNTTYTCTGAYEVLKGTVIHCANTAGHGTQTFTQGLMNSCNPFFINIGQKLGVDAYYKYFEAFGFTERTGLDLTGEAYPVYHSHDKMTVVDLASTSFGQSIRVSPIQMITACCAIANGGKLMKPYVVDSVVDQNGNVIKKNEPTVKRRVISESTAATVRQMMEAVVEAGTGKNAYIPGYRVAGKTATSEKLDLKDDDSGQMKYVASFMCFAPANDPKVAILVGVDEPPGEYRGGGVIAAPIAKQVMESTVKYLNIEPQYTEKELESVSKTAPDLVTKSPERAKIDAANYGFTVEVIGNGDTVLSQVPAAGQTIPDNGVIIVYTQDDLKAEVVKMPDFGGMTVSQANKKAHEAGINIIISGPANEASAEVYNQSIAEGVEVQKGSSVTLYFHSTAKTVD